MRTGAPGGDNGRDDRFDEESDARATGALRGGEGRGPGAPRDGEGRRARERVEATAEGGRRRARRGREGGDGRALETAKVATAERVETAKAAAEELQAKVKPKLRGVVHSYAFWVSLLAGVMLVFLVADDGTARIALGVYAISLSALLGTSALYHRINWKRPATRRWMRRLDHSMIFLLIAGTVTPFLVLVVDGPLADAVLIAVWLGAIGGIIVETVWTESPKWVSAIVYVDGRPARRHRPALDRRRGRARRGHPDRGRRHLLHRRRRHLRDRTPGSAPRRVRLPRDLPRPRRRGRRLPLRRRRGLRRRRRLRPAAAPLPMGEPQTGARAGALGPRRDRRAAATAPSSTRSRACSPPPSPTTRSGPRSARTAAATAPSPAASPSGASSPPPPATAPGSAPPASPAAGRSSPRRSPSPTALAAVGRGDALGAAVVLRRRPAARLPRPARRPRDALHPRRAPARLRLVRRRPPGPAGPRHRPGADGGASTSGASPAASPYIWRRAGEENVAFYGSMGYELLGDMQMPSGPTMWRMERPGTDAALRLAGLAREDRDRVAAPGRSRTGSDRRG